MHLRLALCRARAGDDDDFVAANAEIPNRDDGVFLLEGAARQLVRLSDAHDLVDTRHQLDQPRVDLAATHHAEHDARRTGRAMHVHAEFDELRDHRFDFGVAGALFHHYNHKLISDLGFGISDFVLEILFFRFCSSLFVLRYFSVRPVPLPVAGCGALRP
jgi:hypothetical protein